MSGPSTVKTTPKGSQKKTNRPDLSLDEQLQAEALQRKLLLRKKIGSGAFSVVFEASWLAPSVLPWAATRTFAAKCLYKDQDLKRIEDELRFLRMLRYVVDGLGNVFTQSIRIHLQTANPPAMQHP